MRKKILIGSIIAVVLLTLVSFSSVVGFQSVKNNQDNTIITDEYDSYTTLQLVFLLISKFRYYNEIQYIYPEDEVLQIIESDAELNGIIEELKNFDCGCEDEPTDEWRFPFICILLIASGVLALYLFNADQIWGFLEFIVTLITAFNCFDPTNNLNMSKE